MFISILVYFAIVWGICQIASSVYNHILDKQKQRDLRRINSSIQNKTN